MTIFRYALLRGVRSPLSLLVNCIVPLVLIFIRPLWVGEGLNGFLQGFGLLAFVMMGGSFLMSMSILTDKIDGAIIRILSAPVTMRRYLTENLLSCMVPLTIQTLLISALGFFLYDWSFHLTIVVFLCYTMLILSSVSMSFAWHCLFKTKDSSAGAFGLVLTLSTMLGGAMVPLEILPGILEYIGAVFPIYWMMRGLLSAAMYGTMTTMFWLGLLAMALFTIAYLLYGGRRRLV